MLIVGGAAALTVIAAHFAWLGVRSLRASWRARQAEQRVAAREDARQHEVRENVHSSF
jgi:hypothetical protein